MGFNQLTIEQLRTLINTGEASDPIVFLESIMNGQDPRELSSLYLLVNEIDSFSNGEITKDDWNEVMDLVHEKFRYNIVSLTESLNASKTLAEYLHPKRKQIEHTEGSGSESSASTPLSPEEIDIFKERFNDEF